MWCRLWRRGSLGFGTTTSGWCCFAWLDQRATRYEDATRNVLPALPCHQGAYSDPSSGITTAARGSTLQWNARDGRCHCLNTQLWQGPLSVNPYNRHIFAFYESKMGSALLLFPSRPFQGFQRVENQPLSQRWRTKSRTGARSSLLLMFSS
jgi:hypothetical protein